MNAFFSKPNAPVSVPSTNIVTLPQRHLHREREFGVGYGNSSGYASNRRYAQDWMQPRFRCA